MYIKNIMKTIDRNTINIAYDRSRGCYVAYSIITGIFAIGVCVETACEAYRDKYFESIEAGLHSK